MSGTVAHKLLVILVLACVARLPVPWVHRHADLEINQLPAHLKAKHAGELEWELPAGLHVHFLIPGIESNCDQKNSLPGDSNNRHEIPDEVIFCETEIDAETITKFAFHIAVSNMLCTPDTLEFQVGFIGTQGNSEDQSQGFAEAGQWRYALSVLLI